MKKLSAFTFDSIFNLLYWQFPEIVYQQENFESQPIHNFLVSIFRSDIQFYESTKKKLCRSI